MKYALPGAAVSIGAIAVTTLLCAPQRPTKKQREVFCGKNYAHRGLHKQDVSIAENSLPAFINAVDEGYGIELDVHLTADNRIVVFHDDDLERVCGEKKKIEDCLWAELKEMYLFDTAEHIPLLSDVLSVVNGKYPIIIELKSDFKRDELCERTLEFISAYKGDVCVESFDPRIVAWFKRNAPDVLRGQLSTTPKNLRDSISPIRAFLIGSLLTNVITRPNFVAYKIGKKSLTMRLFKLLGGMTFGWTAHDNRCEKKYDSVIFEYYRPVSKFKK